MEEVMNWEQVSLISELKQGKELAKQLCDHLISSSSSSPSSSKSSSHETNEMLIEKILSCYEKALRMLNWGANVGETKTINGNMMDSHCPFTNRSPRSKALDQEFKHKHVSKRRKPTNRWTKQVKVCKGTGLGGSLDDGYCWRKYGQKDILGAKFPRGYFRCTHRNAQGCLATKQVQKSDEDPTTYEITYIGRHTCTQANHLNKAFPSKVKMGLGENQLHSHQKNQTQEEKIEQHPETNFTLGPGLEVKIEDLDTKEDIFLSFPFPSPSIGSENEDNNIFTEPMMENHFMECFSSESHIFCLSPCHAGSTGLGQNVQTSESDITSALTSVSHSPIVDLDFLLDKADFDRNFPFDTSELFSS